MDARARRLVKLSVIITYDSEGSKAMQITPPLDEQSLKLLRSDLRALKMPLPRRENITIPYSWPRSFSFFWETDEGNVSNLALPVITLVTQCRRCYINS